MAGKYTKGELVGSGTFGKAWLAKKDDSHRKYILKEILVRGMSEKHRKQALTEVEVLAKCKHLNVIRYREAFVDDGHLNIVMEYAENGDLQRKIDLQKGIYLDEEIILDWFVQICFGLRYIHGLNILHRDLKTQNIFLNHAGIVKIGDFGIARILKSSTECASTIIGTPYYLSPEICQKKLYNNKSDMWALGCVLYNMICLRQPFEAQNLSLLMIKIMNAEYEHLPGHYLPLLGDLIRVLLKVKAECRPSASEILCVPALQAYINVYIKRSLDLRESQKKNIYTPSPVVRIDTLKSTPDTVTPINDAMKCEEFDENKENIDPKTLIHEARLKTKSFWTTPKRSPVLRNIDPNIQSGSPLRKKMQVFNPQVEMSPRMSLHKKLVQNKQAEGIEKKRKLSDCFVTPNSLYGGQTYTVASVSLSPVKDTPSKSEQDVYTQMCQMMYKTSICNSFSNLQTDTQLLQQYLKTELGLQSFYTICENVKLAFSKEEGFEEALIIDEKNAIKYFPLILHYLQLKKLESSF